MGIVFLFVVSKLGFFRARSFVSNRNDAVRESWKVRRGAGTKLRQKLAIDLDRWCLFSITCDGFRLCFASD
jgi:hypothetical protein